jgi:hypothetical protein
MASPFSSAFTSSLTSSLNSGSVGFPLLEGIFLRLRLPLQLQGRILVLGLGLLYALSLRRLVLAWASGGSSIMFA